MFEEKGQHTRIVSSIPGRTRVKVSPKRRTVEEMERLDDDDLLGVAERIVAVGEIGQVSGEIGDDVAPRLSRPLSAHVRLFRPFADAGGVKRSPGPALSAGPAG